ncbi:MAG: FmdB family zinc ribbon protein [Anaerolineae bacterium]
MPVYEYICQQCDHRFDLLRSMSQADQATCCPHCHSEGARRAPSRFASFTKGSDGSSMRVSGTGGGCGSCSGGSCGSCGHHH